jgi:hypothetical protein
LAQSFNDLEKSTLAQHVVLPYRSTEPSEPDAFHRLTIDAPSKDFKFPKSPESQHHKESFYDRVMQLSELRKRVPKPPTTPSTATLNVANRHIRSRSISPSTSSRHGVNLHEKASDAADIASNQTELLRDNLSVATNNCDILDPRAQHDDVTGASETQNVNRIRRKRTKHKSEGISADKSQKSGNEQDITLQPTLNEDTQQPSGSSELFDHQTALDEENDSDGALGTQDGEDDMMREDQSPNAYVDIASFDTFSITIEILLSR